MRRHLVAGALSAAALFALPAVASATVVGQTSSNPDSGCSPAGIWIARGAVVPHAGVIKSFSYQGVMVTVNPYWGGTAGMPMSFKVLRPLGGGSYKVLGHVDGTMQTNDQLETFTAASPIPVQQGDVLGLYSPGNDKHVIPGCLQTSSTGPSDLNYSGNQPDGATITSGYSNGWAFNLSAVESDGPTCAMTSVDPGPPSSATVTVAATNGLTSFGDVSVTNGSVSIPTFTSGTTDPVYVTATKTDGTARTRFQFTAQDLLGQSTFCA